MDVCAACGIVAPRPGLPCEACGDTTTRAAPTRRGALYFVSARCRFQCRGCGRLAPLDEIDLSGLARCGLCGLTQAFDPGAWREALGFAHGAGDLAGGEGLHPDERWSVGLSNPHADLGRDHACAQLALSGKSTVGGLEVVRSLRMVAAPGQPLCGACASPVLVEVVGEGQLRTRCPECGAGARYDVPAAVVGACRGLRGVVAEGGRADLKEAVHDAGAVGLSCGGCGAPLRPANGARTVECSFCHLVSRVPADTPSTHADRDPKVLWLVFSGPSAQRKALERGEAGATIRPAGTEPTPRWRSLLASTVVAGGMTVVTGLVLFLLLRFGVVPLSAILP